MERGFRQTREDIVFSECSKGLLLQARSKALNLVRLPRQPIFPSGFSFMQLEIVGLSLDIIIHMVIIMILNLWGPRIKYNNKNNSNLQCSFA